MNLALDNKKFLITGSSRGIGLAIAEKLLEEGSFVVLTARGKRQLDISKKCLVSKFGEKKVLSFQIDCTKQEKLKMLKDIKLRPEL